MKFKVGDKIQFHTHFKKWDEYLYGMNPGGSMKKYQGKVATVTDTYANFFKVDIDNSYWSWDYESAYLINDKKNSDWKFPKVDFVKYDAEKRTTVVKFDGDDEVYIAKCKEGDSYDEYTGLLTCLVKKQAKASNQELQGFIKHADNRRIK